MSRLQYLKEKNYIWDSNDLLDKDEIIKVRNLKVSFESKAGFLRAVRGVNLTVKRGQIVGLVGESGSGKSVCVKSLMGFNDNSATTAEVMNINNIDLTTIKDKNWTQIRGTTIAYIPQDPLMSLNPTKKIKHQIIEAIKITEKRDYRYQTNFLKQGLESDIDGRIQKCITGEAKDRPELISAYETLQKDIAEFNNTVEPFKLAFDRYIDAFAQLKKFYNSNHSKLKNLVHEQIKNKALRNYLNGFAEEQFEPVLIQIDEEFDTMTDEIITFNELSSEAYESFCDLNAINAFAVEDYSRIQKAKLDFCQLTLDIKYKYGISKEHINKKMYYTLDYIGIKDIKDRINSYPHEFSGGMRQRIAIAMAIISKPDVIIADEPTTALDVSIQAKVLDLIKNLRDDFNISIIFISHNIALVANFCDYIYVMYAGKILEKGTIEEIFTDAAHPYTWALISSIPDTSSNKELSSIPFSPPNMFSPPKGDPFAPRNKYAVKIDFELEPPLFPISKTHSAATWLRHPDAPKQKVPFDVQEKMDIAAKSLKLRKRG